MAEQGGDNSRICPFLHGNMQEIQFLAVHSNRERETGLEKCVYAFRPVIQAFFPDDPEQEEWIGDVPTCTYIFQKGRAEPSSTSIPASMRGVEYAE